jgi:hypothetical protein
MDDDAAAAAAGGRILTLFAMTAALFFGLPALGVDRVTTMVAVQMAIAASAHHELIVQHQQTRLRIIAALRRYWRWELSQTDLPALELRLAHLRRPLDRYARFSTILLPAFALTAIVANGLHSVGLWKAPGWAVVSATSLLTMVLCWPLRRWEFQIRDRLKKPICVRPT